MRHKRPFKDAKILVQRSALRHGLQRDAVG